MCMSAYMYVHTHISHFICPSISLTILCVCWVASIVSNSTRPYGLQPTRLLCPWDSPGKNTGVSWRSSSRGSSWPGDRIGVSLCLLHWQEGSLPLLPPGKPLWSYHSPLFFFPPITLDILQNSFWRGLLSEIYLDHAFISFRSLIKYHLIVKAYPYHLI